MSQKARGENWLPRARQNLIQTDLFLASGLGFSSETALLVSHLPDWLAMELSEVEAESR
jgi:hypothetical protein